MAVDTQMGAAVPDRAGDVAAIVRTLAALYNASMTYGPNHPVVVRVIREQLPRIESCLRDLKEIRLFFMNHQVRYGTVVLEPGNSQFQRLAQMLEDKHVAGVILDNGVSAADIRSFVQVLVRAGDAVLKRGLQAVLDEEGVKAIRESREKIGIVNTVAPPVERSASGNGGGNGSPVQAAASPAAAAAAPGTRPPKGNVWDLSAELPDLYAVTEEAPILPAAAAAGGENAGGGAPAPLFREFVHDVVVDVNLGRSSPAAASEKINVEFEKRIQERTEEVEKRSAARIRSLENVRDVMLTEMETLKLPAVLVDREFRLLGANSSGRALVGRAAQALPGTALHKFLSSGREREAVDLPGGRRVAHKVLAVGDDQESGVILITLE